MKVKIVESMQAVKPVQPIAPYLGGKSRLAKIIVSKVEAVPHAAYCEPFVGMGGIFLRRRYQPKTEVINDINKDISTLFRVLQRHYQAFLDMIRWQITTRAEFERLRSLNPDALTDLERAARFLYIQRLAFGGKISGVFGVQPTGSARFNLTTLGPMLEEVHARLKGVVIECLNYDRFILRYDRRDTLFYLDPPYFGNEKDYGSGFFIREDFNAMAKILGSIQGLFIMSLNDRPEIREIFKDFSIEQVETTYSLPKNQSPQKVKELLITNL